MILVFTSLFRFLPDKNYRAMAFWPFILLKNKELKNDAIVLNHEKIHLAQQMEYLVVPFYLLYFSEYIYYRLKGKNHDAAYRSISFEKEAYAFEQDMKYLHRRKYWSNYFKRE